jgi:NAD-dependent deacetylase
LKFEFENVVILTGAGLSAESGLATFRDKNGIWAKYNYQDVATPEGYRRNPGLVLDFYNQRRQQATQVSPNAAHIALAKLEAEYEGNVVVVTQNIDSLHELAGSKNLLHIHGEITKALCSHCDARHDIGADDILIESCCPFCKQSGGLRPDVVWFGEMPYHVERIGVLLRDCDLFLSIGTSGTVYPAGFVEQALASGAHTVELNLEPSHTVTRFRETIHGKATEVVPAFVERLLCSQ